MSHRDLQIEPTVYPSFSDGRVQQGNFHDYPLMRMAKMSEIEVHLVDSNLILDLKWFN